MSKTIASPARKPCPPSVQFFELRSRFGTRTAMIRVGDLAMPFDSIC